MTTVIDQGLRRRDSTRDALGRLVQVVEDPGGLNYTTTYRYDGLDDLTKVTQLSQTRRFGYDSLGRLSSAMNPESGTVSYVYEDNGNVHTRTDAAGVVTTYAYDGLNRLTNKTYSDGKTAAVWMKYDSIPYAKGRQTQILTQADGVSITNEITEYDALGAVRGSRQVIGTDSYAFRYGYNLADFMTSEQYPSGRKVVYEADEMTRAKAVGQDVNGQKSYYASGIQYAAHGGRAAYTMGNQVQRAFGYNSRLQLGTMTDTLNGAPLLSLTNAWTNVQGAQNNGSLYAQTIAGGGQTFNQSFTYDAVNRLSSAQEEGHWSRNYGYDALGNMYVSSSAGSMSLGSFTPTNSAWFDSNNRLTNSVLGITYDNPGNLKTIGGQSFEYDAENRQTSASINGMTTSYSFYLLTYMPDSAQTGHHDVKVTVDIPGATVRSRSGYERQ